MARSPLGFAAVLAATLAPAALLAQQVVELPTRDTRIEPRATELYSIGGFETIGWDAFGDVSQVVFDAEGNLHVFDRQTSRISVVSPGGALLRQFGTAGEGPGEMRNPGAMGVTRDGRVFVQDAGHRAYLEYDRNGEFVRQVPMNIQGGTITMAGLLTDPTGPRFFTAPGAGGFMMMMRNGPGGGGGAGQEPPGRPIERVVLGESVQTSDFFTAWEPTAPESDRPAMTVGGGRVAAFGGAQTIWEPQLEFGPLPDGGLAVVDSSAYAVKIVDGRGRHVRTIRRPSVKPVQVTDRVRNREIERRLAELEEGDGPQMSFRINDGSGSRELPSEQILQMQRDRLEQATFFPEIPVVADVSTGWDGLIWLERAQVDPSEPGPIDLLRPDGRYVGTLAPDAEIRTPRAFGPHGLAAFIERDEFDVPTITVRRLGTELR